MRQWPKTKTATRLIHVQTMPVLRDIRSGGTSKISRINIQPNKTMKPTIRYQSQLLFRRSYKPLRTLRIRPVARINRIFRPVHRFGMKPRLEQE